MVDTLVVIVDGYGKNFLGMVLPDDILIEICIDLANKKPENSGFDHTCTENFILSQCIHAGSWSPRRTIARKQQIYKESS